MFNFFSYCVYNMNFNGFFIIVTFINTEWVHMAFVVKCSKCGKFHMLFILVL